MASRALALLLFLLVPALAWGQTLPNPTLPLTGTEEVPCIQNHGYKACTPSSMAAGAANNAALTALPHTAAQAIVRQGYASAGDSPPLVFTSSASACTFASGAGDGGLQVPTSDGGCWNASLGNGVTQGGLRIEWWGISQTTISNAPGFKLYVCKSGTLANCSGASALGTDANGNTCILIAYPCLTWGRAVTEAGLFDVEGGNVVIHDSDTTAQNFAESVQITSPLRGAANNSPFPNNGGAGATVLFPSQVILDGNSEAALTGAVAAGIDNYCYTVAATNDATVGIENITIAGAQQSCQDGLFAQLGGQINVYSGVTFTAAGSNGCNMHVETSSPGISIWNSYTIGAGTRFCFASLGASGTIITGGQATITGSPTFTTFLLITAGSVFQSNIANPWGSSPGTITGPAYKVLPGGTIDSTGNAIAWPGSAGILYGGNYRGDGLLLGTVPSIASSTGIGTGGSAGTTIAGNTYRGLITITAGSSGTAATGTITVSFPSLVRYTNDSTPGQCTLSPIAIGTGSWAAGSVFFGNTDETSTAGGVAFIWSNNGSNLTVNDIYTLAYNCGSGS